MMIIQMTLKMPMPAPRLNVHPKPAVDRSTAAGRFCYGRRSRRLAVGATLLLFVAAADAATPAACRAVVERLAREPAAAQIELTAKSNGKEIAATAIGLVGDASLRGRSALSIAYVDSGLVSEVKAGENKGARLTHDHVVRAFKSAGVGSDTFSARFTVPAEAGVAPTLVAFLQNTATGDVLQAVALPLSDCGL